MTGRPVTYHQGREGPVSLTSDGRVGQGHARVVNGVGTHPEGSFVDVRNTVSCLRMGGEIGHPDHPATTESVDEVVWMAHEFLCQEADREALEGLPSHCEVAATQAHLPEALLRMRQAIWWPA